MALIHCHFHSQALGMATDMNVILPQPASDAAAPRGGYPVLYLLHGLLDDYSVWLRRTSVERYCQDRGLVVVMPSAHRSFYTDMAHGYAYWQFISRELPRLARSFFPISAKPEATFVAGLSMGGYGALKLALSNPRRYAAAASLSGAVNMANAGESEDPSWRAEMANVFGDLDTLPGSKHDLFHLAAKVAKGSAPVPRLYVACGTEDFLYADNVRFHHHLQELDLPVTYDEGPGEHNWAYWDQQIQLVLDWLPMP